MTKLCSECQWSSDSCCRAPNNIDYNATRANDLVGPPYTTTEVAYKFDLCSTQRVDGWLSARLTGTCGREGRWWVSK